MGFDSRDEVRDPQLVLVDSDITDLSMSSIEMMSHLEFLSPGSTLHVPIRCPCRRVIAWKKSDSNFLKVTANVVNQIVKFEVVIIYNN